MEHGHFKIPATGLAGLTSRFDREKPIIAAINGAAVGGGFEIALACDLVVAASHALFSLPEVRAGTYAGAGGLTRLPGQVGDRWGGYLVASDDFREGVRAFVEKRRPEWKDG